VQGRREAVAAKRAHERGVDPRVAFELIVDVGAALYLEDEMTERCRPEAVKMLDEALATKPPDRRKMVLRREWSGIIFWAVSL
jgi:hypothetical protein